MNNLQKKLQLLKNLKNTYQFNIQKMGFIENWEDNPIWRDE